MILIYFIFTFGVGCLVLWIYQSIILPSIRQRLRFELFNLRDRLRELVIAGKIKEESAAFEQLHRRLNTSIHTIPRFDVAVLMNIEADDHELRKRAQRFSALIGDSIPEVQAIYKSALDIMAYTLFANSFFWFLLVFLAVIPVAVTQGLWKACKVAAQRTRVRVIPAFEVREMDFDRFSPLPIPSAC